MFGSVSCHLYGSDPIIRLQLDCMKSLPECGPLALVYDKTEGFSRTEAQQIKLL
jgi:hypothetical protein